MKRFNTSQKEALALLEIALNICALREISLVSICSGTSTELHAFHDGDFHELMDCFSAQGEGACAVIEKLTKPIKSSAAFVGEIVP